MVGCLHVSPYRIGPICKSEKNVFTQRMGTIYALTCRTTGEQYVGATRTPLSIRWSNHKSLYRRGNLHQSKLRAAFDKWGVENFSVTELCVVADTDLIAVERETIRRLDPALNTYETPGLDERSPTPWRRRRRRQEGVPEQYLDAPAYDPTIRRRRLWEIEGESLTSQQVVERYGQGVMDRLYRRASHPTRKRYEHHHG